MASTMVAQQHEMPIMRRKVVDENAGAGGGRGNGRHAEGQAFQEGGAWEKENINPV